MGDLPAVVLGIMALGLVGVDVLSTTLSPVSGPGPLTKLWGRLLWLGLARRIASPTSRWWLMVGPGVLLATIGSWVLLLIMGWWLVLAATGPVVEVASQTPVGPAGRLYFVVAAVSTLGLGDIVATSPAGRVVTVVAAVTGLGLVTLSVTYVLPVLTAVTDRRVLATTISAVGTSAVRIAGVLDDAAASERLLDEVGASLRVLAQRHHAYPILHFFHSTDRAAALAPSIAALDEALGLLVGSAGPEAPSPLSVRRVRAAVDDLLDVTGQHLSSSLRCQAPPSRGQPGAVACRHSLDEHRRQLHALVIDDGWTWQHDVVGDNGHDTGRELESGS